MVPKAEWSIQVPKDLRYFPVNAGLLFSAKTLGNLNQTLQGVYDFDAKLLVPDDIAGFELRFGDRKYETDLRHTLIRLGFVAQVINHLIATGTERYRQDPNNAGHGYAVTVINSGRICSDVLMQAHGTAALIDTANKAGFPLPPLILAEIQAKGFLANAKMVYKFNADQEGPGKEGIMLRL